MFNITTKWLATNRPFFINRIQIQTETVGSISPVNNVDTGAKLPQIISTNIESSQGFRAVQIESSSELSLKSKRLEPRNFERKSFKSNSFEPKSFEPKSCEPKSFGPNSFEPNSFERKSVEPESFERKSVEPKSFELKSFERNSVEPKNFESAYFESTYFESNNSTNLYNSEVYFPHNTEETPSIKFPRLPQAPKTQYQTKPLRFYHINCKMPPVATLDDVDDGDVAFKVLNQDNLPIAVIGEGLLKPFGRDSSKQKPNGIVFPQRRITTNLEESKTKTFAKSNGHIEQEKQTLKKKISNSQGNLNQNGTKIAASRTPDRSFTRTLDAKLRKLQKEEKARRAETMKKPLFVTTVKRGQFIQPPEVCFFKTKDDKKLYAYASKPRVLNRSAKSDSSNNSVQMGHKTRCDAAAKAAAAIASSIAGISTSPDGGTKDINSNVSKRIR